MQFLSVGENFFGESFVIHFGGIFNHFMYFGVKVKKKRQKLGFRTTKKKFIKTSMRNFGGKDLLENNDNY